MDISTLSQEQRQNLLHALTLEKTLRDCKVSYYDYVHYTNYGHKHTRCHKYLCDKIQDFITKPSVNDLFDICIITLPWQHGKSLHTTESLPAWLAGYKTQNSDTPYNIILTGYGDNLTNKFADANKSKIINYNNAIWPDITKSQTRFNNDIMVMQKNINGRDINIYTLLCQSIMASINGEPADVLIIDDPYKNIEEAHSELYRTRLINNFENTGKPRIKAGGKLVVVMTRQGHNDFIGYLTGKYGKYITHNITLPLEAEENDILGRSLSEPLCPEIGKGKKWIIDLKETTSSMLLATQYQCRPSIEGGNVFKNEWWKYYTKLPVDINQMPIICLSVDATFKDNDTSDFVAIQCWGKFNKSYYYIDDITERLDIIKTLEAIETMLGKYPISKIFVEDKANGSAIVTFLQQKYSFVYPVNPLGGKLSRAHAAAPYAERGNCFLPEFAPFTEPFKSQLANFPNDDHDDRVDAFTQTISNLSSEYAVYEYKSDKTILVKWTQDMIDDFEKEKDPVIQREMLKMWGAPENILEINYDDTAS